MLRYLYLEQQWQWAGSYGDGYGMSPFMDISDELAISYVKKGYPIIWA